MNDTKPFWASRTLWVNVVAIAVMVATHFGLDLGLDEETQLKVAGLLFAVVNGALRLDTSKAVKL